MKCPSFFDIKGGFDWEIGGDFEDVADIMAHIASGDDPLLSFCGAFNDDDILSPEVKEEENAPSTSSSPPPLPLPTQKEESETTEEIEKAQPDEEQKKIDALTVIQSFSPDVIFELEKLGKRITEQKFDLRRVKAEIKEEEEEQMIIIKKEIKEEGAWEQHENSYEILPSRSSHRHRSDLKRHRDRRPSSRRFARASSRSRARKAEERHLRAIEKEEQKRRDYQWRAEKRERQRRSDDRREESRKAGKKRDRRDDGDRRDYSGSSAKRARKD